MAERKGTKGQAIIYKILHRTQPWLNSTGQITYVPDQSEITEKLPKKNLKKKKIYK